MELPDHILILIMEYFSFQEKFKYHTLNKELSRALHTPFLYEKLMIKSKNTIFQSINACEKFTKFINMATHLKIISLKHCSTFNREVLNILNNNCNPFVLSELYLDGCEGVNDQCFDCLMLTKEEIALEK
jgi:hypothetical protein